MSWAKIDDRYPQHRKFRAAGPLRPLCIALDVTGICHCATYATDGFVSDGDLPNVLADAGLPRSKRAQVLAKLVEVGRWDRDDQLGGYWIHDFLAYNPSAARRAELAEQAKKRAAVSRSKKANDDNRAPHAQRTHSARAPNDAQRRAPPRPDPDVPPKVGAGRAPPPPAAEPSPVASGDGSAADDPEPRPPLHVIDPDRPPPPKLSVQLRAGDGEVPDAAKAAADAALGAGWREKVRPTAEVDPAKFEAERQRQIAAIREQFGEQFAPEFEPNDTETEHETSSG